MQANYDHEQLIDFIEGDLPPEGMARVDAMLASDPKLRRLIEAMKADRKALRSMPHEPVPVPVVDDLLVGMERQMLLGEAPVDEATDPIEVAAQRHRMRIGPRLLRVASYTGIAAALAFAASVVIIMLTESSLLEEADPELWGNGPAVTNATESADAKEAERLALADLDKIDMAARDALSAIGSGDTAAAPMDTLARADDRAFADPLVEAAESETTLNAAQVAGGPGQFALSLPDRDQTNVQIEVISDNAAETTRELHTWFARNDVQIVSADDALIGFGQSDFRLAEADSARADDDGKLASAKRAEMDAYHLEPGDTVFCVVIDNEQVPELMSYMNRSRDGRQTANIIQSQQPQRLALAEVKRAVDHAQRGQAAAPGAAAGLGRDHTSIASKAQPSEPASVVRPAAPSEQSHESEAGLAKDGGLAPSVARELEPSAMPDFADDSVALEDDGTFARRQAVDAVAKNDGNSNDRGLMAKQERAAELADATQETARQAPVDSRASAQVADMEAADASDSPNVLPEAATDRMKSDDLFLAEVNAFDWGSVLGNQLPLASSTPLVLSDRGRVVLPVVIRESRVAGRARLVEPADASTPAPNAALEVIEEPAPAE